MEALGQTVRVLNDLIDMWVEITSNIDESNFFLGFVRARLHYEGMVSVLLDVLIKRPNKTNLSLHQIRETVATIGILANIESKETFDTHIQFVWDSVFKFNFSIYGILFLHIASRVVKNWASCIVVHMNDQHRHYLPFMIKKNVIEKPNGFNMSYD